MAVGFVEARAGHMSSMGAESVGPAVVVHLATLDGDVALRSRRQRSWWSNCSGSPGRCAGRYSWGRGADCAVSAMVAGFAGCEAAKSLLVDENESALKTAIVDSVRGRRQNYSVVVARRPVFSIIANVSVVMVILARGTSPNAATRWMFAIFCPDIFDGCIKIPRFG